MVDENSVTLWLGPLQEGDARAAQEIWDKYYEKLIRLARNKLGGLPRRAADEEDVALSAFHSFCQAASQGRFPQLDDRHNLWRLLVVITARKASEQVKSERREKRGAGKLRCESVFDAADQLGLDRGIQQVVGEEPTPEFAALLAEQHQQLMDQLDDELRTVVQWKLDGDTNAEIAEKLGRNVRSVQRRLELIRRCVECAASGSREPPEPLPGWPPMAEASSAPGEKTAEVAGSSRKTQMKYVAVIVGLMQLCLCCCASVHGGQEQRAVNPNVVVVFIDDMGWADFSCFGNRAVETQNIDRLASEGIRFEQFYVNSPICSPSRVAISTGQYPQRWKITSYLSNRRANEQRGMAQWLDPKAPMLARVLHDAGYATGHFGKWHMGGQRDVGEAPLITDYGFDTSLTNFEGLGPRVLPLKDAYDGKPPKKHALGSDQLGRGKITWQDRSLVTASFTEAALAFVQQAAANDQPFYVNVWPDDVHSPFFPPKERRGDAAKRTLYHGVLDTMDEQLGVLFDFIRGNDNLRDNTLILICSDNGPELGAGSAGDLRGFKTHLFEGGIRSPLIAWGPGLIKADKSGSVNTQSVLAAIDVVPTLLAITNVTTPDDVSFDGEALPQTLLGKSTASRSRPLFFRRPPDRDAFYGESDLPDLAVRDGKWKLLCEYDGSDTLLFDLSADRGETVNLVTKEPKIMERLTAQLLAWHRSMPADNGENYREVTRKRKKAKK
jgi:uncharacterized sulfatase